MILIPLIQQTDYSELKFCLRAIDRHHPEEPVAIASSVLPKWIRGIHHVPATDSSSMQFKARNIFSKILATFAHFDIDELLFFNDDHIIFAPVDYLHHKGLMTTEGRAPQGIYTKLLQNTLDVFPGCYDFDTHCPIRYERTAFEKLAALDWSKPHGYGIKSSYCAANELRGEFYPDVKFRDKIGNIEDRLYISTADSCDLSALMSIYPHKSKFEI